MVTASEVTVVFQGPLIESPGGPRAGTAQCIEQVRRILPSAEIVLSTWVGSDAGALPIDQLVLSDDPGNWKRDDGVACNCNRQIVSTVSGIRAATRRYVAKIRTDTTLDNTGFLDVPRSGTNRPRLWQIFRERILVTEKYSRDPAKVPLLHHISDLFQFGLREDLLRLWSVPLANARDCVGWSKRVSAMFLAPFPQHRSFMKYADEQYVWISCLRNHGLDIDLEYYSQCRFRDISASESLLTANFVVVSEREAGVEFPERFEFHAYPESCYKSEDWPGLTKIYGDETSRAAVSFRALHVWLSARAKLAMLVAHRFSPLNVLRSRFHADHALRRTYRKAKARLRDVMSPSRR